MKRNLSGGNGGGGPCPPQNAVVGAQHAAPLKGTAGRIRSGLRKASHEKGRSMLRPYNGHNGPPVAGRRFSAPAPPLPSSAPGSATREARSADRGCLPSPWG